MTPTDMKQILFRMPEALAKRLDEWRRVQEDLPTRSEAIRRILEKELPGVPVPKKAKPK